MQQTAGGVGHTFEDIKDMCRGAEVKSGLNLKFSGTAMKTKKDEIEGLDSAILSKAVSYNE